MPLRLVLESLSKAMVTIALMLTVLILVQGPMAANQARPFTAWLLALGTLGLIGLRLSDRGTDARR